jgi:hypothetical protein
MTRLELRGGVALAVVILIALVIAVWGLFWRTTRRLLGCSVNLSSFIFARTSYTSRHRKLAVSAIVRPWSSSFLRSLMSASDHGAPEFASIGFSCLPNHAQQKVFLRGKPPDVPYGRPPSRHKPGGNPAMQQSPAAPGVLSFGAAAQARVQ